MDPEKLISDLTNEIAAALKALSKAKTTEEKINHSVIVKNLCESLGVFLGLIRDMSDYGYDEDDI